MKEIFIIPVLLLLLVAVATAQVPQGTIILNGNFSVRSQNYLHDKPDTKTIEGTNFYHKMKENRLYAAPSIGYLIKENLEAGLSFGYNSIKYQHDGIYRAFNIERDYTNLSKGSGFTINPYVQKYLFISDKFAFTGKAQLSYSKSKFYAEDHKLIYINDYQDFNLEKQSSNNNFNEYAASIAPGIAIFVSHRMSLSATLGALRYIKTGSKTNSTVASVTSPGSEYNTKSFGFSVSPEHFNFGLGYFIGR